LTTRFTIAALVAALLAAPASRSARAAEVRIDEDTRKAVARSLEWLASKQEADGSWGDTKYPHNSAITSYVILAFLSQGHLPNRGTYGPEVAKGMRFLISCSRASDGYLLGTRGAGNMYCHGMATLVLAQLWGMTGDEEVKPVLEKAVKLIIGSQNREGGWRYDPLPTGADISVTIMQVMALRAAKNAGLHVPDVTMTRAIEYIDRCYDPKTGGFSYQAGRVSPGFARTAAGLCVLFLTGKYEAKNIPKGIEYLKSHFNERSHFWYGHYYAGHAMHQVGGKDWEEYYALMKNKLLSRQASDGSWTTYDLGSSAGPVMQTAIAGIVLSIPTNYLPIFQR